MDIVRRLLQVKGASNLHVKMIKHPFYLKGLAIVRGSGWQHVPVKYIVIRLDPQEEK